MAIFYLAGLFRSAWRHYLLVYYEGRSILLRRLVSKTERFVGSAIEPGEEYPGQEREQTKELLTQIARILHLNPFDSLQRRLMRHVPAVAATTVWLHVPDADSDDATPTRFRIADFGIADEESAGDAVIRALQQIQSGYRAAGHDDEWYQQNLAACQDRDGRLRIDEFRDLPERPSRTSLAGLAFAKRTSLSAIDPELQCVFDDSFLQYVDESQQDRRLVDAWMRVKAKAAFVILDPFQLGEAPLGVLVIWKNSLNGITTPDLSALATASRMLGLFMGVRRRQQAATDESRGGRFMVPRLKP